MNNSDLLEEFIVYLKVEKQSSVNTITNYESDIKYFKDVIDKDFHEVTNSDISEYIKYLNENYKDSSVARKISSIKNFYKYCHSAGLLKHNPTSEVKYRFKNNKLPNYLSVEEINLFLNSLNGEKPIDYRNKAMFETLYATGMRVSEIVNLQTSDVYLEEQEIKVVGKGNKERIVIINEEAIEALEEYIFKQRLFLDKNHSSFLFLNQRGGPLTRQGFAKVLKKKTMEVGLYEVSPHILRHSIATHMLQSGIDIRTVQELLGHTNISVTQIYTHLDKEKIKEKYNEIDLLGKE